MQIPSQAPAKMVLIQFHLSKVFSQEDMIYQESGENTIIMQHLLNRLGEDGWSVDYTKVENIILEVFTVIRNTIVGATAQR